MPRPGGERVYGVKLPSAPERIQPNEELQGSIVEALTLEQLSHLFKKAPKDKIAPERRERVLRRIARGDIAREQISELLLAVEAPAQDKANREKILEGIKEDPHQMAFLSALVYGNSSKEGKLKEKDLGRLLKKYPDPASCGDTTRELLRIFQGTGADKYKMDSMRASQQKLMRAVYGARMAVWEQIWLMRNEALKRYPEKTPESPS